MGSVLDGTIVLTATPRLAEHAREEAAETHTGSEKSFPCLLRVFFEAVEGANGTLANTGPGASLEGC